MPISRRYTPEHAPGDAYTYGFDFSYLLPPGVGIAAGSIKIFFNTVAPSPSADFAIGPVSSIGRTIYAKLSGGIAGTDYQLRWSVTDTLGNTWNRTATVLCADTS